MTMSKVLEGQPRSIISDCRKLIEAYVDGRISLRELRSEMLGAMLPYRHGGLLQSELTKDDRILLDKYDYWVFGSPPDKCDAGEDPIPVNPNWEYGKGIEEFGWYDQEAYKQLLVKNFLE